MPGSVELTPVAFISELNNPSGQPFGSAVATLKRCPEGGGSTQEVPKLTYARGKISLSERCHNENHAP